MKTCRFTTLALILFFLIPPTVDAQENWWRYGMDEMVVIKVRQQPALKDTLAQTFLVSNTLHGAILINKLPLQRAYSTKEDLDQFNKLFLEGLTMDSATQVLSFHTDTIESIPCLRFSFRKRSQNLVGEGFSVALPGYAYGFQFVSTPEDSMNARGEREYFLNSIEFSSLARGAYTNEHRAVFFGRLLNRTITDVFLPLGIVGIVIAAIVYFVKGRRRTK